MLMHLCPPEFAFANAAVFIETNKLFNINVHSMHIFFFENLEMLVI